MSEFCPLARRPQTHWDADMPEACRPCFASSLVDPLVRKVAVGDPVDSVPRGYWKAVGLRACNDYGDQEIQRLATVEIGKGTETTGWLQVSFLCPNMFANQMVE